MVAAVVTGGVALAHPSPPLLAGILVTYGVGTAVALRYPPLIWGDPDREWDKRAVGTLSGVLTFGSFSMAGGVAGDPHYGAGIFALGLGGFGAAVGVWLADTSDLGG